MNQRVGQKPAQVLLVEDSPTDVLMTQEALEQMNLLSNLHVVEDGVEAVAFLRRTGSYGHAPRPDLILLDCNLPRKDGREVLIRAGGVNCNHGRTEVRGKLECSARGWDSTYPPCAMRETIPPQERRTLARDRSITFRRKNVHESRVLSRSAPPG